MQQQLMHCKQRGIGMIEILVTLFVLAIGLLGAAQLQIMSLQNTQASEARMIATLLASDLGERLRANSFGSSNGFYDDSIISTEGIQHAPPSSPACTGGCTAAEQADQDVREWLENFVDVKNIGGDGDQYIPTLPDATAHLEASENNTFELTITWKEQDTQLKQRIDRSYVQVIEL